MDNQQIAAALAQIANQLATAEAQRAEEKALAEAQRAEEKALAEAQRALAAKQLALVEEQNEKQNKVNNILLSEIKEVKSELAEIKSTCLIIAGRVISDFEGISNDTKERLETEYKQLEESGGLDEIEALKEEPYFEKQHIKVFTTPKKFIKSGRFITNFQLHQQSALLDELSRAERQIGAVWLQGILAQLFGYRFHYGVPRLIDNLCVTLLEFYNHEREETGRKI